MASMGLTVFVLLQLASLAVMALFIHEYRRISYKHEQLIVSIDRGKKPMSSRQSGVIIWVYVVSTVVVLVASTALYMSLT